MTATDGPLAMFPLGSVLLPGMALPLRVFEPRYRQMVADVQDDGSGRFGVVLIERGSEVGGGDVRTDVGCTATIRAVQDAADGTLALLAVGEERVRVREWLPEDPYPRALVERWPDEGEGGATPEVPDALTQEVLEVVSLALRLIGEPPPAQPTFSEDPVRRCWELATLAPLGALDRQRVLRAPGPAERVELLWELVGEQRILLEARERFGQG